ncbi:Uncharacterized protein Adt_45331 [Abeliophyllum distichum]|uniref:Uncharacterized protein n=1 Tax=Abeliophyllum distichum TaxID=126358 RepID=A0ABD1PDD5_9LAMI
MQLLPSSIEDVDTESNANINHPQEEFSPTAQLAVLQAQVAVSDKNERLKDFIARFNRATLEIKVLQMSCVITTMMSGTQSRPFMMSLSKNPSDMMHELLRKGDKYVDAEEAYFITKGMKYRKEPESNKR